MTDKGKEDLIAIGQMLDGIFGTNCEQNAKEIFNVNHINTLCVICKRGIEHKTTPEGVVYWTEGNNAQPVADGRCCDSCDCRIVIPSRMGINPNSEQGKSLGEFFYTTRVSPQITDDLTQQIDIELTSLVGRLQNITVSSGGEEE
ncbi:MAG: hypothetical protein HOC79_05700 [Euryarchaeota archaeon]|jgi:hypothetical protein|nr:hypothetical protein [Euryarchaeota archaeon]